MVVFLLATALAAEAHFSLRFAGLEAERSRLTFAARGAANEFLSGLNGDPTFLNYTPAAPFVHAWGDLEIQAWQEPVPGFPHLRRIAGRAYPKGMPEQARQFTRVVRADDDSSGLICTNVPLYESPGGSQDPDTLLYRLTDSGSWQIVPPAPRLRYTNAGALVTAPGQFAGSLLFTGADTNGHIYAVYPPALDYWPGYPSASTRATALNMLTNNARNGKTFNSLVPIAQSVSEQMGEVDKDLSEGAVVMRFDIASGAWQPLPPVPDAAYDPTTQTFTLEAGNFHVDGLAGPMAATDTHVYVPIYRPGPDCIYQFTYDGTNLAAGTWSLLPSIPSRVGAATDIAHVAVDGHGGVYTVSRPFDYLEPDAVLQLKDGAWQPLPDLPPDLFDPAGVYRENVGSGQLAGMAAGRDGALYVVASSSDPAYVDTLFKWAGGRWSPVPNQQNLSDAGNGPATSAPKKADLGVDAEGQVLIRQGEFNVPDDITSHTSSGFTVLPSLPNLRYDPAGTLLSPGGTFEYSAQVLGGGRRNSAQTVYKSTASF